MRHSQLVFAICLVSTLATGAWADLRVEPSPVQMDDLSETALIRVYQDGQPVKSFTTLRFTAPKYAFAMYEAKPLPGEPGAIVITPVPGRAEDGSYTLLIAAGGEQTTVDVLMTLPIRPIQGVTIGLEKPDSIRLPIAAEYPVGMRIQPSLDPVPGRTYEWWVDGKLTAGGMEKSSTEILADDAGAHTVALKEYEGDRLTAEGTATFNVVPEKDQVVSTRAGRLVKLRGNQPGVGPFTRFEWFRNNELIGSGPEINYLAEGRGDHRIVLLASEPTDASYPFAFREIQWVLRAE